MKKRRTPTVVSGYKKSSGNETCTTDEYSAVSDTETNESKRSPKLKQCQYCGGDVAPDAPYCVHCGTPSPLEKEKEEDLTESIRLARFLWKLVGIAFLISLAGILLFPSCRG